LTQFEDLNYLEDTFKPKEPLMFDSDIVEISLLLSKAHLQLLEELANNNRCSLGEAVRLLLKQTMPNKTISRNIA